MCSFFKAIEELVFRFIKSRNDILEGSIEYVKLKIYHFVRLSLKPVHYLYNVFIPKNKRNDFCC